jgi:hypothetical protein
MVDVVAAFVVESEEMVYSDVVADVDAEEENFAEASAEGSYQS